MVAGVLNVAKDTGYVSVKIKADVYRIVKTVASFNGVHVADYLSEIAKAPAERDFAKMQLKKSSGDTSK